MQTQSYTSSTTTIMAYPPRPGSQSPTLTEPDMILPLQNETTYDSESSSPHTSFQFASMSGDAWQRPADSQYQSGLPSKTPTTPIIYGNGTMLSDIGEVTEAESTPAKKLPGPAERRFIKQQQLQNGQRVSSVSLGHELRRSGTKTGTHERKISMESASTITSEPQSAMFEDIDDTVSVDDSNFQGDDEESVAESYTDTYREELVETETRRLSRRQGNIEDGEDDQNSSAALSRRAEQILLNAKRRLNNMEGNLTRARSSLYVTPSISMPSIYSSSPLTNPSLLQLDRRISGVPSRQRSFSSFQTSSAALSPGHSRVWSENNISPSRATAFPVRASSAAATYRARSSMGSHASNPASPGSPPMIKEESNGNGRSIGSGRSSPHNRISPSQASHLEPLVEDGVPEFDDRTNGRTNPDRDYSTVREGRLSRSSSTSSIRMQDIQHQMHDLKGRLSALRDRARDDNMRRRSLQSLRTPSPFTAGEQWYNGGVNGQDAKADSVVDQGQSNGTRNDDPSRNMYSVQPSQPSTRQAPNYAKSDATSIYEDVDESQMKSPELSSARQNQTPILEEEGYDTCSEESEISSNHSYNDDREEFNEFDNEDNSDASIYHESVTEQISHEDREDAFDYEHFFLHSAMGTISRERRGSVTSEDSVETTRGPTAPMPLVENGHDPNQRSSVVHLRSDSNASISTLATFATAKSNMDDEESSEDEEYPFDSTAPYTDTRNHNTPDSPTIAPYNSRRDGPIRNIGSTFGSLPRNTTIHDYNDIGIARGSGLYDIDIRSDLHSRNRSLDSVSSNSTARSFPLSIKVREFPNNNFTPPGTASSTICHPTRTTSLEHNRNKARSSPTQMLSDDDQMLVERLVASLGKCISGLQNTEAGNYDSRIWRRRLDAARRILDGEEGAI
ncbi:fe35d5e5-953c-4c10-84ce-61719043794c [Sclerotinia trifoliorum]|uniref:Fe35d5e5-953c-4c10-84ce-61719043794c n=1 Tax=Sclerotinia trifoliorum TaxID=28548 RepID=A0A8H2VZ07_9HELO|nr:fe35d5e5-953c-4c10-84ce-61719043794c [Sclerotinia trifoliorum]